ncbi:MAG TPA: ABC transporter ATP-binding protein [Candidatus Moranbacteria bacterium]|nr:ABC transporter ATP-binding protein [Candidatus Moranbacteria bacterium]
MNKNIGIKGKNAQAVDYAVKVVGVSKKFKIPHEKINSVLGVALNVFKKKTYEEFEALDDVSFEVKKGEFFGIIGRNGSGKSTLLKILAGIYKADKGKVQIDGMISPFLELGIGFNPELSGRDNVYLNATVLGLTKKQIDEKFDSIVKFSELEKFIDQKLKNYSSGMQVRLAFSVSIHANRDILLMDEVLAVGDSNFQSKCIEEFNKYRNLGRTIVLVSHDVETVRRYCDRAMLIRFGKIKKIGNVNEIVDEYLRENIIDEEKRIEKMNEKKECDNIEYEVEYVDDAGRKFDRKIANILEVKIFNQKNIEKNVYASGEIIRAEIKIEFKKETKDPIFGITVRDSSGKSLFITNTWYKKIETGLFQKGIIQVDFEFENAFANGTYSISPAIADKDAKIYFDWKHDMKSFVVLNEYASNGIVDFKHNIFIKK